MPLPLLLPRRRTQSRTINMLDGYILGNANNTLAALNATGGAGGIPAASLTKQINTLSNPANGVVDPYTVIGIANTVNAAAGPSQRG